MIVQVQEKANKTFLLMQQVWRLLTNFFYFGNFGIDFFFHMFFLVRYSRMLEEGSFRGRTADFLVLLLYGMVFMLVAARALSSLT